MTTATTTLTISSIAILLIGMLLLAWYIRKYYSCRINLLEEDLKKHKWAIKSAYVKFGKTFEHFAPFTATFPGDKDKFIFLGQPIDGIIFEDHKITFVEIKTGNSVLSEKQQRIKNLIEKGSIEFKEVRY